MDKLDLIVQKLHEIEIVLTKNTESLIIHEKRTDLAESKLEVLNTRIDELKEKEMDQFKELTVSIQDKFEEIQNKIAPIKTHVEVMDKVFNIVWKVIIPCVIGFIGLLYKIGWIKV